MFRNVLAIVFAAIILAAAFPGARLSAQGRDCTTLLSEGIVCPPALGTLETDVHGNVVCGAGQCVRNSAGEVMCSPHKGGAIYIDLNGNVSCVGGCVKGEWEKCVKPEP